MFRKLLNFFGRRRAPFPAASEVPKVVTGVPHLDQPILVFMESEAFVTLLSTVPSWRPVQVRTFAQFAEALAKEPYAMLIAMSPSDDSGAAGRAIRAFREANPDGLTIYHGIDYRLSVTGPRGLACAADFVIVGGVHATELVCFLGSALLVKRRNVIVPSMELYTRMLTAACAHSPFWKMQDLDMPPFEVE